MKLFSRFFYGIDRDGKCIAWLVWIGVEGEQSKVELRQAQFAILGPQENWIPSRRLCLVEAAGAGATSPAAIDAVVPFFDSCRSEVLVDLMYRDDSAGDGSLVALSHRYWHRRIP